MSVKEEIKKEIDKLPENILTEVFDFIKFVENKKERQLLVKASQELSRTSSLIHFLYQSGHRIFTNNLKYCKTTILYERCYY